MLQPVTVDRLSALFENFRVRAHLIHAGALCGLTRFPVEPGRAFLHVLRRGSLQVTHAPRSGAPRRLHLTEPTLLLYPRPLAHEFRNAPEADNDFTCASLYFDGGAANPLVRALPPLLALRIEAVEGIAPTLGLLYAETERVRCGQRLLADRLFEVLLLQVLRWLIDHPPAGGDRIGLMAGLAHARLARALTAMHERPGQAWTLSALATCAGMSRSAFASEFRRVLGTTPGDYLLGWRVSLAQTRLRAGDSLKRISADLGYASPAAFSRAFTQAVGRSPRAWLRLAALD